MPNAIRRASNWEKEFIFKMSPQVTVYICTHNRANLLAEAIRSVLSQTYADIAAVVLDNCSDDNTPDVVNSFDDPRLSYVRHEKEMYAALNWNSAIDRASTEYFCVFHDDDIMLPWMLEEEARRLDRHPRGGLVGSKPRLSSGKTRIPARPESVTPVFYNHREFVAELARVGYNPLLVSRVLFRGSVFDGWNLRFKPHVLADVYFWAEFNLSERFQMCVIEEPLFQCRVHNASSTRNLVEGAYYERYNVKNKNLDDFLSDNYPELDLSGMRQLFAIIALRHVMNGYCAGMVGKDELAAERKRLETEYGWLLPDWRFEDKLAVTYLEDVVMAVKAGEKKIGDYLDAVAEAGKIGIKVSPKRNRMWFGGSYIRA